MTPRRRLRWLSALALPLVSACSTSAQQQALVPPLRVSSTLVLVPALVRDRSGQLVFNLHATDFLLTDDGVSQKLTLQPDNGGDPLALVVVVESGAAQQTAGWHPEAHEEIPNRLQALPALVDAIAGDVHHAIAVVGFDSKPTLLLNFTRDPSAVKSALDDFTSADNGDHGSAILDSIGFAVNLLHAAPAYYRRAILLISETNDRDSKLPLADALRAITSTNTAIFTVAYSSGSAKASHYGHRILPTKHVPTPRKDDLATHVYNEAQPPESPATAVLNAMLTRITFANLDPNPPHGCMSKQSDPSARIPSRAYDCAAQLLPPLALARMAAISATDGLHRNIPQTVASLTGGEYFRFNSPHSLEQALVAVANHLPNRYVLSFQPQSPHPGPHALKLTVPQNNTLSITSRTVYWADPAPN